MNQVHKLIILLALVSFCCRAEFQLLGSGSALLMDGKRNEIDFGFSYLTKEGAGKTFHVGKQEVSVEDVPEKYTLTILLQNKDKYVWIQEFAPALIETFHWKLGEHVFKLEKNKDSKLTPKGNYVFFIDGEKNYFAQGMGQIIFYFKDDGLDKIETNGLSSKPRNYQ
ncbi:hypothetical protein [Algicola sagamiensis]|uniref:hypothetical protein n=1 Tax=Algicola sagamiensis TaxID=163869 RepID=UPI000363E07A|nr:hypothetical protein [Algicola sagamiensis]